MKRSIKRRIFTVNLFTITLLLVITALAFNLVARTYLERDTLKQLESVAFRAESSMRMRKEFPFRMENDTQTKLMQSYIELFMSMRGPVSMLNAEYALIDNSNNLITPFENFDRKPTADELAIIQKILTISKNKETDKFTLIEKGTQYAAVIKHIQLPDDTKAGTLLIYSSLDKINEMSRAINMILMIILVVSSLCVLLFSNYLSKGISDPLSKLNNHIRDLSELNFSNTLYVPADNEIQELVQNINKMAEKLDTHNKSQKLFLQNVSHEFRTPIMSIQSYAEGIQYGVVESKEAAQIIVDESKRLTHLVEEVLYLSRLDAIEEVYSKEVIDVNGLLRDTCRLLSSLAEKEQVFLNIEPDCEQVKILGDAEKLERCFTNILSNGIRYAQSYVNIESYCSEGRVRILFTDDGPGIDKDEENQIFNRFYKGKKGNTGLGLAISKSIIEKHNGSISAKNTTTGAQFIIELPAVNDQNKLQ